MENNWPIIGDDKDGDGIGEPVSQFHYPVSDLKGFENSFNKTINTDQFDRSNLDENWQWQANPKETFSFLSPHQLKLYARYFSDSLKNLYNNPNLLMQKFTAEQFEATTKLTFHPLVDKEKCGLIVFGYDYSYIGLQKIGNQICIVNAMSKKASENKSEDVKVLDTLQANQEVYLKVKILDANTCKFSYSFDEKNYNETEINFTPKQGKWVGAKVGLFAAGEIKNNDCGSADFEWFKIKK